MDDLYHEAIRVVSTDSEPPLTQRLCMMSFTSSSHQPCEGGAGSFLCLEGGHPDRCQRVGLPHHFVPLLPHGPGPCPWYDV